LIWSFLSIAIATAVFLFTSAFFDIPLPLKTAIIRSASNLQDFSRGVVQQNPTPPNSTRAEIPPNDLTHRVPIRVALVIGNNDYPMGRLRNAVSDAEAVSKKLESKGFQILYRPNATRNVMLTAIEHFKIFLALGGIGIVYYSGHGAHFRDSDYMVPIDIPPDINALNFTQHAVNLTELLRPIDKIISNTPESSGDAIMYATASDSVAMDGVDNHSPFAHALLDALSQKSIELSDIFRFVSTETLKRSGGIQTPWLSSSFNKYFHFDDRNYDMSIGILKILFFDTCRNNPFKEASR